MRTLVTSALPYSNNTPHLGNIVGCVLSADVYARYKRMRDGAENVLFICGTDEYGTTTEVKARNEGVSCEDICDRYHNIHQQIYDDMNISFDHFGRTTTDIHTKVVQDTFIKLYDNGLIKEKSMRRLYCGKCDLFLADRMVKGICYHDKCKDKNNIANGDQCDHCGNLIDTLLLNIPFCITCGGKPKEVDTDHLFLCLSDPKTTAKVSRYMSHGNHSDVALDVFMNWFDTPAIDRCITRDIKWGVPVPVIDKRLEKYKDKVLYVWFDAPLGYKSITQSYVGKEIDKWWSDDTNMVEFMAKDNVIFHSIIFPTMLRGSELPHPRLTMLNAVHYLMYEGEKFSKSNNIGIFGDKVREICDDMNVSTDYFRYYLMKIRPETKDSNFDASHMVDTINADINNNFGNCVNRIMKLVEKYIGDDINKEHAFTSRDSKELQEAFEKAKFHDVIRIIMTWSTDVNLYLNDKKPWDKNVSSDDRKEILITALLKIINVAYFLRTIIPQTISEILSHLGCYYITEHWIDDINSIKIQLSGKFTIPYKRLDLDKFNELCK